MQRLNIQMHASLSLLLIFYCGFEICFAFSKVSSAGQNESEKEDYTCDYSYKSYVLKCFVIFLYIFKVAQSQRFGRERLVQLSALRPRKFIHHGLHFLHLLHAEPLLYLTSIITIFIRLTSGVTEWFYFLEVDPSSRL